MLSFYIVGKRKRKRKATHNRCFERNDWAIRAAVFELRRSRRDRFTAQKVAKIAGLTRQTFYHHYSSIGTAPAEIEEKILAELSAEINQSAQGKLSWIVDVNTRLFYTVLVFMAQRRAYFSPACADVHSQGVLYQMAEFIYPKLEIEWLPKGSPAPAPDSQRAKMLIRVIAEILSEWGAETGCNIRRTDFYVRRLLQAVDDAARNRLP